MKRILILFSACIVVIASCKNSNNKAVENEPNGTVIEDPIVQDSLYQSLRILTRNSISTEFEKDSLAFLLLPVQATCPTCRKKTIDSIVKYADRLDRRHFIVVAGTGSRSINGYFKEQQHEMPMAAGVFYDTVGLSKNLTSTNPNIYYSSSGKVYRKVSCLPRTIRSDLRDFFANM